MTCENTHIIKKIPRKMGDLPPFPLDVLYTTNNQDIRATSLIVIKSSLIAYIAIHPTKSCLCGSQKVTLVLSSHWRVQPIG